MLIAQDHIIKTINVLVIVEVVHTMIQLNAKVVILIVYNVKVQHQVNAQNVKKRYISNINLFW